MNALLHSRTNTAGIAAPATPLPCPLDEAPDEAPGRVLEEAPGGVPVRSSGAALPCAAVRDAVWGVVSGDGAVVLRWTGMRHLRE
jgi:hypothetical protein